RITALAPQRLPPVDVADPGPHALVEEHRANRHCSERARPCHPLPGRPIVGEDVWPEMAHLRRLVADELHHRSAEADGDHVIGLEQGFDLPRRPAPSLAAFVEMPRALHPHVGVDSEAVVYSDQHYISYRLDLGNGCPG